MVAEPRPGLLPTPEQACKDVYQRGRARALAVGRSTGVTPVFFWQPVNQLVDPSPIFRDTAAAVGAPTIDLSHVAVGDEERSYVDAGHMTERGASLVAQAMWEHLRPMVEEWYAENG